MKISELLPCGRHAPGCISLQGPVERGVQIIWWGTDGRTTTIVKAEQVDDHELPEPLVRAILHILAEVFSSPTLTKLWAPGDLGRAVKRARTVLDLQVGPESYDKALRTKGRLGAWLQPQ